MRNNHVNVGLLLLFACVVLAGVRFCRARKRGPFRVWGWWGLGLVGFAELMLFLRIGWVATFFTPLVWTGYLLLADAAVFFLKGESLLAKSPKEFLALAFWSVPLWLVFEAYNLRLGNWTYVGLPGNLFARGLGFVWSFGTIWPALYETADLARALDFCPDWQKRPWVPSPRVRALFVVAGVVMLTLPVLLPARAGQYLFAAVWLGFIFLLDPVNDRLGGHSLLRDWEKGRGVLFFSLVEAGIFCGLLWEFWNYWARAKWLYVFPIGQSVKVFEMPLAGYLGFPAFALECYVMYEFVRNSANRLGAFERALRQRQVLAGRGLPPPPTFSVLTSANPASLETTALEDMSK